jgi:hypothetical protein
VRRRGQTPSFRSRQRTSLLAATQPPEQESSAPPRLSSKAENSQRWHSIPIHWLRIGMPHQALTWSSASGRNVGSLPCYAAIAERTRACFHRGFRDMRSVVFHNGASQGSRRCPDVFPPVDTEAASTSRSHTPSCGERSERFSPGVWLAQRTREPDSLSKLCQVRLVFPDVNHPHDPALMLLSPPKTWGWFLSAVQLTRTESVVPPPVQKVGGEPVSGADFEV